MENAFSLRADVLRHAEDACAVLPDTPWMDDPESAVLRHPGTRKWFGLLMTLPRARLGLKGEGTVDVLNVKGDPPLILLLRTQPGFRPAYHMNKEHWLTVLLDGSVEKETIFALLDASFASTRPAKRRMQ